MKKQFDMMQLTQDFPLIELVKVQAFVYRARIETPVQTSFGVMYDRPVVLVRIEDALGRVGWGEVWCNFPSVGAEHRARVLESCAAPILLSQKWAHPQEVFETLTQRLRVLAIQSGEQGTMAQVISGVDIAMWDLVGKQLSQPLWRLFGGVQKVSTYASGLSPTEPEKLAMVKQAEGYDAFKLKVGFGMERDVANLRVLRETLGSDVTLMVDANQAWIPDFAIQMSHQLAQFSPIWLEEPLAADSTLDEWKRVASESSIPIAAGENMRGEQQFTEAIDSGAFAVLQPDIGKWGGFSGCVPVAHNALSQHRMLCPHWLGGGLGLVASMHFKAIVGGSGYVEVDSNPNPLRDLLMVDALKPKNGVVTLMEQAGLGVTPSFDLLREFLVSHQYN